MNPRRQLQERLRQERENIVTLCADLIRHPSENPPGDTTRIAEFVTTYLDAKHVDYRVIAPQPSMPNILATIQGADPGKHLVLNGHLDVFPAGDWALWSDHPYAGNLRDDKLFGRGASDMKTGDTASLMTFLLLSEFREYWKGTLTLTLVSDEETFGPWGAAYLLEHYEETRGDCVLNGEPSTPGIVRFGEKGILWLEMQTKTHGGHGGYPHISPNAIMLAGKILAELEQEFAHIQVSTPSEVYEKIEAARPVFDVQLGPHSTDTLYQVTINIGTITGGTKVNMIANACRTEIDIRCPIGYITDQALKRFEAVLERYEGASYRIINRSEPNYTNPNFELMTHVTNNAKAVRGIQPRPGIGLGGTDCRLWRLRGIPGVIYGPTPYNMGAPDEYVTLDDLLGTVWVHVLSAFDYLSS